MQYEVEGEEAWGDECQEDEQDYVRWRMSRGVDGWPEEPLVKTRSGGHSSEKVALRVEYGRRRKESARCVRMRLLALHCTLAIEDSDTLLVVCTWSLDRVLLKNEEEERKGRFRLRVTANFEW